MISVSKNNANLSLGGVLEVESEAEGRVRDGAQVARLGKFDEEGADGQQQLQLCTPLLHKYTGI